MKRSRRVLVGLKTMEHAAELTDMACRFGAKGGLLLLVHVIELPDPTPLNADVPDLEVFAKKIVDKAKRIAQRSEMKVATLIVRAHDAAAALLDEIKEKRIDLAVLGYHHRRTIGEIMLGTTARRLATTAPCHLILSIPPRSAAHS